MRLSIVTTLYYSAPYIRDFYHKISVCAAKITNEYEVIFVNDGSPDDSLEIALSLYKEDKKVKIIDLSRNFGHHKAIMTGLMKASGDFVFLIDSDLEEPPELLTTFDREIKKTNSDVVYGVQKKRKGKSFEQFSGEIYYFLFNILTGYNAEANVLTARIMTQTYVKALVKHREREFDIMGLWTLTGFKQSSITVEKLSKGTTSYNLRRKISLFINTVTAFSSRPLFGIFSLGIIILACSIPILFYLILQYLLTGTVEGWAITSASIWTVAGLIISCMGIIGIYISKMVIEIKRRPYTIIRKFYGEKNTAN